MAHDHKKQKTHVPKPPASVDPDGDVAKAMHMQGQINAGHYEQLPTTQTTTVVGGHKQIATTVTVRETDPTVAAVDAPV